MTTSLNLVYIGSPSFSAHVLKRILNELSGLVCVRAVITQPDRPVGRNQVMTPTALKEVALQHNIPVYEDIYSSDALNMLKKSDLALLYAYGLIIKDSMLTLPRWGFWNIHPSLLPRYRGTSPIAYTLLMGDSQTGVSLMEMDTKMDHGAIIDQKTYMIGEKDTREMLENRLSDIGYELFKKNVQLLIDGTLQKREQNHHDRTFTRLLTKQNGFLPFAVFTKIIHGEELAISDIPVIILDYQKKYPQTTRRTPSETIFDFFRGLSPWPGIWTLLRLRAADGQAPQERRLKITGIELRDGKPVVTHVQLEGKKEVTLSTFLSAYPL